MNKFIDESIIDMQVESRMNNLRKNVATYLDKGKKKLIYPVYYKYDVRHSTWLNETVLIHDLVIRKIMAEGYNLQKTTRKVSDGQVEEKYYIKL